MTSRAHGASSPQGDAAEAIARLRSADAVRERCHELLAAAERGALAHLRVHPERLDAVASYVLDTTRRRYPDGAVPLHGRWRHFAAGGVDRWGAVAARLAAAPPEVRARARIDLAVVSVLLDAGAGESWRYTDPATGASHARSEGLALASLELFASGALSSLPEEPLRVDAERLRAFDDATLSRVFQIRTDNALAGVEGRVGLLNALGEAIEESPHLFGETRPRAGNLLDCLAARRRGGALAAGEILAALLDGLAPIWPGRLCLGGENLGDVWRHPAVRRDDASDGLVPFHKLSQWLAYSLVEPLEEAGVRVAALDDLTALAEYRNGGLLLDLGALALAQPDARHEAHHVGSELVVEWRALTVALIDRVAEKLRRRLGEDAHTLPLAKVLEGGTWAAGRRIARELRPGGEPPLRVVSDGTVF